MAIDPNEITFTEDTDMDINSDDFSMEDDEEISGVYSSDNAGNDDSVSLDSHESELDLNDKVDIDKEVKQPEKAPDSSTTQPSLTKESLIEMLKDPTLAKMLADINKPPLEDKVYEAPKQNSLPPVDIDKLEFTAEEISSPQTFGKAIASKVMGFVDSIVAQKVKEVMDYIEPVRGEYSRSLYQKEVDSVTSEYGDIAKPYFTKGTPQYEQLANKFINTPGITIKEAFMLLNPQKPADIKKTINAESERKATEILKQKQQASTRVPINKTPIVKTESNKLSAREAALKAMGMF